MTTFWLFGTWKISSRYKKRLGSLSHSEHLWTFWSLRKRILAYGETAGLPFAKWPFSDVSAPEIISYRNTKRQVSRSRSDHFSTFRCLGRHILTSGEMCGLRFSKCPFFPTFRHLKSFVPKKIRPGFRSRSKHFSKFRIMRKRILAFEETVTLPFAKWPFFPMFWHLKNFPSELH